jgi:hypothetical protein
MTIFADYWKDGGGLFSSTLYNEMIKFQVQNPQYYPPTSPGTAPYTSGEYGYALYRDQVSAEQAEPPLTIGHGGSSGTVPYRDLESGVHGIIAAPDANDSLTDVWPVSLTPRLPRGWEKA